MSFEDGLHLKKKHVFWIVVTSLVVYAVVIYLVLSFMTGHLIGCDGVAPTEEEGKAFERDMNFVAAPPEAVIDTLSALPDLGVLANDSTGKYNGWCDVYPCELYGGLRAGDWGKYLDSTRYACTLTNTAKVPKGADSTKFAYIDTAGYHPDLVTVAVFYRGKRYDNYYSKSTYDLGVTNCLWTSTCRTTWTSPLMGLPVGGADRYDPNLYTALFGEGDLVVVVVWVNKNGRIKEQRGDNNIAILPWRRTDSDPRGWVLDWSALTPQNKAAIKKWISKG